MREGGREGKERERERMSEQVRGKKEMRAKEGERGRKRTQTGKWTERGGNSYREIGRRERSRVRDRAGSMHDADLESPSTLRPPPRLTLTTTIPPPSSRVVRSPCTGGVMTTRARGGRDGSGGRVQRGRDRPKRRGADCIVHSIAPSATPTTYNCTSTPPSAADMQADAPPWPLTTANAL